MPIELNATHDPARRSWVDSANAADTDFPIQNLPFGRFRVDGGQPRTGVALGVAIIDLDRLLDAGLLTEGAALAARTASGGMLAALLDVAPAELSALRRQLADLYGDAFTGDRAPLEEALVPMAEAELLLPLRPSAFTDFCASYDHIRRMGGGPPKAAALSLPVAYNARASSVSVSGTPVVRPSGQFETQPGSGEIRFGPEPLLDFELEFGAWLRGGNALGRPVDMATAEEMLFGCCLVNDWSARGIQFLESILGPHLGKSFLTTISPWIVTMEALAPFRVAARGRPVGEPDVPDYLAAEDDRSHGAIAVELTAELVSNSGASTTLARSQLADLYWTPAQMVAHQASNGAPLESGDLIATGTVSGPEDDARGCLAEIVLRGGDTVTLPDGTTRKMLEDGDTIILRGRAQAEGYVPIGFGDCAGTVQPAVSA